jgi:tRNA G10  N-methylase Trm11
MIRSVSDNQEEILTAIRDLHCGGKFDCDVTYGNGVFYKNLKQPTFCFDIEPLHPHVIKADSTQIPLPNESIESIVFDPPFLTYVRAGRKGNGNMVMGKRFAGYWRYEELQAHYERTIDEAFRVLKHKGKLIFKCQDIIHNHKMHCTHFNVIDWAMTMGFRLADLFVLVANHRMPSPNRKGKQRHARIFHSYFLVLEKTHYLKEYENTKV